MLLFVLCFTWSALDSNQIADGNETSGAYGAMLKQQHRPSMFALTRQKLPNLAGSSVEGVYRGAYVLQREDETKAIDVVLVGTGSEVSLCVEAAKELAGLV